MRCYHKKTEIIVFVLESSAYMHQIAETKESVSQPCANNTTHMTRKHNFDSVPGALQYEYSNASCRMRKLLVF